MIVLHIDYNSLKPIYIQIAEGIKNDILSGRLAEKGPVYSQLVLSKELGINPATAAKGINVLVQNGILEKQRGMSMVVAAGARSRLIAAKQDDDLHTLVAALVSAARKINLSEDRLLDMVQNRFTETAPKEGNEENE
ncbi:MAG: GntR family transcriptional regulator [Peptococcaceae bacterium]|nr:GntR family transcriptional regulator [Peptococcaceae bacterium]